MLLPRSPNLQSVILTELGRLKDPMVRKRDCLQQAIDNDQALIFDQHEYLATVNAVYLGGVVLLGFFFFRWGVQNGVTQQSWWGSSEGILWQQTMCVGDIRFDPPKVETFWDTLAEVLSINGAGSIKIIRNLACFNMIPRSLWYENIYNYFFECKPKDQTVPFPLCAVG